MRKCISVLIALVLIFLLIPTHSQAGENQVVFTIGKNSYYINDQPQTMDAAPFIEEGRTFVPIRYLALSLGVPESGISWNPANQTVTLEKDETTVTLAVGTRVIYVNFKPAEMDVAPVIRDDRTYLPARYVAEAFGYQVGWDARTRSVLVGPPGRLPEPKPLPDVSAIKVSQATVTRVVDGDTIYVTLNGREEKVRFIGVNTPESATRVEPYGKEASSYTKQRLTGRTVYLEYDVGRRDKYGRLLAYVWLERPNSDSEHEVRAKMFNAELLLNGYAQVMTVPPNVKYADMFVKFQREAREQNKGLWGISVPAAPSGEVKYVGNSRTKKFHYPECKWAQKISPQNRVEFRSRDEAIRQGYVPCKVCEP